MSDRHLATWRLWLKKLSPLSDRVNVLAPGGVEAWLRADETERKAKSGELLDAMAEALAYAAPQGPHGFACVDDCRCDDGLAVSQVYEALIEEHHPAGARDPDTTDKMVRMLSDAIRTDHLLGQRRSTPMPPEIIRGLSKWQAIIGRHSVEVAHARQSYPNTWQVIHRMAEETR